MDLAPFHLDFLEKYGINLIQLNQFENAKKQFQFIINDMYPVGDGALWLEYNQLKRKLSKGRSRINCTAKGKDGLWRWYGHQFYL